MSIIDNYEKAKQAIFDHVGYVENWRILPIVEDLEAFWIILGGEGRGGEVRYAYDDVNNLKPNGDKVYANEIYTQRFLLKWVYRGKKYTMICVDTHCDLNQYLQVFDNSKEITEKQYNGT